MITPCVVDGSHPEPTGTADPKEIQQSVASEDTSRINSSNDLHNYCARNGLTCEHQSRRDGPTGDWFVRVTVSNGSDRLSDEARGSTLKFARRLASIKILDSPELVAIALSGSKKADQVTIISILSRIEMLEEDLRSMTSVLAEMRLVLSGDVEENPGPRVFIYAANLTGYATGSQHDVVLFTASGGEFINMLDLLAMDVFTTVGDGVAIQRVNSGDAPQAIPLALPVTTLDAKFLVCCNGTTTPFTLGTKTDFDSFTMAAGDTIVLSFQSAFATGINIRLTGGSLPASTATGVTDVNVVGFSVIENPLWVSKVRQSGAPITPPPESEKVVSNSKSLIEREKESKEMRALAKRLLMLCGDVESNPGPVSSIVREGEEILTDVSLLKGRPNLPMANPKNPCYTEVRDEFRHSLLENCKSNPFANLDIDYVMEELVSAANEMTTGVREWMMTIIDPDWIYRPEMNVEKVGVMTKEAFSNAEPPKRGVPQPRSPGQGISQPRPLPDAKREEKRLENVEKSGDKKRKEVDLYTQQKFVIDRIISRFTRWDDFLDWVLGNDDPPSSSMVEIMFDKLVAMNKFDSTGATFFVAESIKKQRNRKSIWQGLAMYNSRIASLEGCPAYQEWMKEAFISDDVSRVDTPKVTIYGGFNDYGNEQIDSVLNAAFSKVSANKRNKEMHAKNGNTDYLFPKNMKDIEETKSIRAIMEADGEVSGDMFDPVRAVEYLSGILGPQGARVSDVPREMAMSGSTISTANAIKQLNDLNAPEALLYPLRVRNGVGAALIDQVNRPPLFGVGTVRRKALTTLVETPDGVSIRDLVARSGNIRADQVTERGFYTRDIVAMLRMEPSRNGDTIQSPLLKMMLYNASRAWAYEVSQLPIGTEPGKFDAFTVLNFNPTVTLGFDNATVFAADCGAGTDPVFPYLDAGVTPTVAFHASVSTVPPGETFMFLPPGLLLQNDRGSEAMNIALFVMMMAPYPCGIHTVTIDTLDNAGGNLANQEFIPNSDLVHVPGQTVINVILPVQTSSAPPANGPAAAAAMLVNPRTGPTATAGAGALAADVELEVCSAANYVNFNLADYLYTWMSLPLSQIDCTTITRFYKSFATLMLRTKDIHYCWELTCALVARYPAMFEAVPGVKTVQAVNSAASVAQQNFFGLQPHLMTADYPEPNNNHDWVIADTNIMWMNKIMSGAFFGGDDGGDGQPFNYAFDASPKQLQYMVMTIRNYAVVSEYLFTYLQYPREVWNSAFTQLNYTGILQVIRALFISTDHGFETSSFTSDAGYSLARAQSLLTHGAPCQDMYGDYLWEKINSPRVGFQGVWSVAGAVLELPTPSVLPDIWVQMTSKDITLAFSPMLSTNKQLTGIYIDGSGAIQLGAGGYTVPVPREYSGHDIGIDTVPVINDKSLFNSRLAWHVYAASLYTFDNAIYNVSTVASGNVVAQKGVVADWTVPDLMLPSILTAKTTWMPFFTIDGRRLAVGVTALNGGTLLANVMSKSNYTGVASWLVKGAHAMPNAVIQGGGDNFRLLLKGRPRPSNSLPSYEAVAPAGQEDQVIEP
jgi:hypothetical protein